MRDADARDHMRATRIALRLALSRAVGGALKPSAWRFQTSSYGKPQVGAGLPEVHFSVSHIDTMAVIAVSRDGAVGVDIETVQPIRDGKQIDACCSPKERRALMRLDEPLRQRAFARLWTQKEAYSKLTGTGLAADFRYLEFGISPELEATGLQTQRGQGGTSFTSWLSSAAGGLCQVTVAVGDAGAVGQDGEIVCFEAATGRGRDFASLN